MTGDERALAVAERASAIRELIDRVERPYDHPVGIVAVTKGFESWAIAAARAAGLQAIGENYAQELLGKRAVIDELRPEVHFIGRLQTNKVRQVAGLVDVWSSLDRPSIVREVAKRAPGATVLLQVDTTGDPNKGGCPIEEAPALVALAVDAGLEVVGLMTVGPTGAPAEAARPGFSQVRALVDDLGLTVCSMGMTADLTVAVEEGSTEVRVGTALFGTRP